MLFQTQLQGVVQRTHNVKSFHFPFEANIQYNAGQYMEVFLDVNGEKQSHYFTISSSPTEKGYVEFTKKITDSAFSQTLDQCQEGHPFELKIPMGDFVLKDEDKKIAFLSGGIGITPIRSMLRFVTDKQLEKDIVLLYGNQTEEDIVFRQELDEMSANNKYLKIIHTLEKASEEWKGCRGLITADMIMKQIPEYTEHVFFLCGPPKMVESLKNILEQDVGVSTDHIKTENFSGYD